MDKAKMAINEFMHKSGHHDTTVHEAVAPAVQHEVVKPHVHEEILTAVDKEVHQDHYHRTVQPIVDREVLPEEHITKLGAVQHREFDHRDESYVKKALIAEQQLFKDERRIEETTRSQSAAAVVGGEHIHHHIHETIQPVIQREVIQPQVIHTTVPIHEVHHNKATVHEVTALPVMTLDQFKAKGGTLTGREEKYDAFEGVPKNIGSGAVGGYGSSMTDSHSTSHGLKHDAHHGDFGTAGTAGALGTAGHVGRHDGTHAGHIGTDGPIGSHNKHHDSLSSNSSASTTAKKPSLMDKLNPKVDSNGDGKAGFMK